MLPIHTRYAYSPISMRLDYSWPGGKRLAFYIAMNIEVYGFQSGRGPDPVSLGDLQTHRNFAWRDYGNRVGIWALFDLFDELKLPMSCLINSLVYEHHPQIIERARRRGDDLIGHGRTNGEWQRGIWELDEKRLIADATETITKHEGRPPKGWLSPGASETSVTPDLLKEAGYKYSLNWPCDDQPIWLNTRSGPLLSVPYPFELNDIGQITQRQQTAHDFCDMMVDQFDEMIHRCDARPLVCAISLHTYIMGQPFRVPPLRKALRHIIEHPQRDRVWFTGADAISDYCHSMSPGIIPGSRK